MSTFLGGGSTPAVFKSGGGVPTPATAPSATPLGRYVMLIFQTASC